MEDAVEGAVPPEGLRERGGVSHVGSHQLGALDEAARPARRSSITTTPCPARRSARSAWLPT